MKSLRIITAVVLLALGFRVSAIVVNSFPYEIKFDRATDTVGWHYAGTDSAYTRHWVIGSLPGYDYIGDKCLYVTENGRYGISQNKFGQCAMTAYCQLTQMPAGTYNISFRYRSTSRNTNQNFSYQVQDSVPVWELSHDWKLLHISLLNDDLWQEAHATFTTNGSPVYLVFRSWVGANATDRTVYTAPAIDDILITEVVPDSSCQSVATNLRYTRSGNNAVFNWDGYATDYNLQYFMNDTPQEAFYDIPSISGKTYTVDCSTIPEGTYTIRVRPVCGSDYGAWTTLDYKLIYDNRKHGLDYLNFADSTVVEGHTGYSYQNQWTRHVVDSGYKSIGSRHTIHHIPHDTDPRTNYRLKTFPAYQPAAVRLGNWNQYGEAEDLVYMMHVDTSAQIMKLQYALVMQLPEHDSLPGPKFQLQLLDTDDQIIDSCSVVNFTDSINLVGWDTVHVAGQRDIVWKDWSLMSFHIGQYAGQNIKLRMVNMDCRDGQHFGYAYFTLSKEIAQITGARCDSSPAHYLAEEGFKYRWYRKYETPLVVRGTNQMFTPDASDTATYSVDLINLINENCYFTMDVSAFIFEPDADFTYQRIGSDCNSYIQFTNTSTVVKKDPQGSVIETLQGADSYYWSFGKYGSTQVASPRLSFPLEGDTIRVVLYAHKGECVDSMEMIIEMPAIEIPRDTQEYVICKGESVVVNGKAYTQKGHFIDTAQTVAGCDSILDITINMLYPKYDTLDFVICEGDYVTVGGNVYTNEGEYVAKATTVEGCDSIINFSIAFIKPEYRYYNDTLCPSQTPYNWFGISITETGEYEYHEQGVLNQCDSVIHINNAFVYPQVQVTLGETSVEFCEGHNGEVSIPVTVKDGIILTYDLVFDETLLARGFQNQTDQPMPEDMVLTLDFSGNVPPSRYTATLTFHNYVCDPVVMPIELVIMYTPDSIITQRWNDFLAVRKHAYDQYGGFRNYQWYRDGQKLEGETNSELYLPEVGLSMTSTYQVELTRTKDDIRIMTCYYHPTHEPNSSTMTVAPSNIKANMPQPVTIVSDQNCFCQLFTSSGVLVNEWNIEAGSSQFEVPPTPGIYILRVVTADGTVNNQKIMVE